MKILRSVTTNNYFDVQFATFSNWTKNIVQLLLMKAEPNQLGKKEQLNDGLKKKRGKFHHCNDENL